MDKAKKVKILGIIANSTKTDVKGKRKYSESRMLFIELVPAIKELKDKHPDLGARNICTRLNKVMNENGYPKFKVMPTSIDIWFYAETGEHLASDEMRKKGKAAMKKIVEKKGKGNTATPGRQIFPDEPVPEETPQVAEEPIGLEQVATMNDDEFIIDDDAVENENLAIPPDPFGGV